MSTLPCSSLVQRLERLKGRGDSSTAGGSWGCGAQVLELALGWGTATPWLCLASISIELVMYWIFLVDLKDSILCRIVTPCREITGYRGFLLSTASLQPAIHWFPICFVKVQNRGDQCYSADVNKVCPLICITCSPLLISWADLVTTVSHTDKNAGCC